MTITSIRRILNALYLDRFEECHPPASKGEEPLANDEAGADEIKDRSECESRKHFLSYTGVYIVVPFSI